MTVLLYDKLCMRIDEMKGVRKSLRGLDGRVGWVMVPFTDTSKAGRGSDCYPEFGVIYDN